MPPLQLTSKPIPVPDRMAVKANPWAIGFSTTMNIAILCVLLFLGVKKIIETRPTSHVTPIDISDMNLKAPKMGTQPAVVAAAATRASWIRSRASCLRR